jgi:hypothetical protein
LKTQGPAVPIVEGFKPFGKLVHGNRL